MQIEFVGRDVQIGIDKRRTVGERVRVLLERFHRRIERIEVRLVDANGAPSGVDRRCMARVRLDDGTQIVTEARASLIPIAIDRALRRMARRIVSLERRRQAMRRIRRGLAPSAA